jgi:hypothetical protein
LAAGVSRLFEAIAFAKKKIGKISKREQAGKPQCHGYFAAFRHAAGTKILACEI